VRLPSGTACVELASGTGRVERFGPFSRVIARYVTWGFDGAVIADPSRPAVFAFDSPPVPFLAEVLPTMAPGSKVRCWVPNGDAVVAEVELVAVEPPPAAPVDVRKPPRDAATTPSGLRYVVLKAGTGNDASPNAWARVTVDYTGWQADGTVIASTSARGRPELVRLNRDTMPGWREVLQQMHTGETVRVWIPQKLAWDGAEGKPKGALTYDLRLLAFTDAVPPPDDLAGPSGSAVTRPSGLAYRVLEPGTGDRPTSDAIVEVNYTGWTADGAMFDTTTTRGRPMRFALSQVIPGWAEVLPLVHQGETVRVWVPDALAYGGQPGKPAGPLVFDLELVSFVDGPATPPDLATPPANGRRSPGGVTVRTLEAGSGTVHPIDGAKVEVRYSGWTTDGKMFDSTELRGEPATFRLGGAVPKGLVEGIELMVEGERARMWIPEELAATRPGTPRGTMVSDVELLGFDNPVVVDAPPDVAAPPPDATRTASGLAYRVLQRGTGVVHPTADARVVVHYSGWTTDGRMVDSSVGRGEPATFPLSGVIRGWTEGVQLMVVGEVTRFWIPVDLAYQNRPGRPAGTLVFDIELLEIQGPR
jgi:FKBP-type peptidyl-prolyl cis-trans isomerase